MTTIQKYIDEAAGDFNLTSDKMFVVRPFSMTDVAEGLVTDGSKAVIRKFDITVLLDWKQTDGRSSIQLALYAVQTAGVITNTYNITAQHVAPAVNAVCSDEFGLKKLTEFKLGRVDGIWYDTNTNNEYLHHSIRHTVTVPQNLIALLNKESQSERLQNLQFVLIGRADPGWNDVRYIATLNVDYTVKQKGITIR